MFHERIKSATTTDHQNAEKHSYGKEIMSRTLTKDQYGHLLIANYRYIKPWEDQWSETTFDTTALQLDMRKKTSLLEDDMRSLGIDPTKIETTPLETSASYAEFMGRMYVIEGSTMGGAVIVKQLGLNPNLEGLSFKFYGGYGPDLLNNWRSFLGVLNTIENKTDQDIAIESAKATFNAMKECFIQAKTAQV